MAWAIAIGVGAFLAIQQLFPTPPLMDRGTTYQAYFGPPGPAIAAFSAAIAADPYNFMTHYRRGVFFQSRQRLPKALADLDMAVLLSPTPVTLAALGTQGSNTLSRATAMFYRVVLVRLARAAVLEQIEPTGGGLA